MSSYIPPRPLRAAPTPPTGTSGVAIASLVLGIPGLCIPLLGIGALVCGIIGLSKTKDNQAGGRGMAIAGLILGIVGTLTGCMIPVLLPSLNRARETANRVKCGANMRQVGQALVVYASSNQGQYPPSLNTLVQMQLLSN